MPQHHNKEFLSAAQLESVRVICLILRTYLKHPHTLDHILKLLLKFAEHSKKEG